MNTIHVQRTLSRSIRKGTEGRPHCVGSGLRWRARVVQLIETVWPNTTHAKLLRHMVLHRGTLGVIKPDLVDGAVVCVAVVEERSRR